MFREYFDILGTSSRDNLNEDIISIIHHKFFNFIGVQFHPERNQFNTNNSLFDIVTNPVAVKVGQIFSN